MPEGILCNRNPIDTKEQLDVTLADKGGKQYYEEMKGLGVDVEKLQKSLQDTCKARHSHLARNLCPLRPVCQYLFFLSGQSQ